MPIISIVIPAYNVEKYISRCLDSILAQTFKDIEVIVVNDGSTDNTSSVVKKYCAADKRVLLIEQENKGLSGARNSGLKNAHGSYIGFVDSDDWVDEDYYEVLYKACIEENADIVSTRCVRSKGNGNGIRLASKHIKEVYTGEEILVKYLDGAIKGDSETVSVCTKLYKQEVLNGQEFEEGRLYEDVFFNWRIHTNSKVYVRINNTHYYYYINTESITTKKFTMNRFDLEYAAREIKDSYKGNNSSVISLIDQYEARTEFSLLCKMLQFDFDDDEIIQSQLEKVRSNYPVLIKSNLLWSRKIVLHIFRRSNINSIKYLRYIFQKII